MKFGMFYPVAVASEADLGKGLWGLDRDRYANTIEELREQATPDEVGEEIQRLKDTLDVEYIIFVMYGGITQQKRMLESIRLFGEKVIPKFADAKAAEPALATA